MMNYNKVILMGRVTANPVLRVFDDGSKVVNFTLATNRTWKGTDGQRREDTCFTDCKAFGTRAQAINDFVHKGRPLFIDGHLHLDKWVDKDTQKNKSRLRVVVDNFEFIDKKSENGEIPASAGNSFMAGSEDSFDALVDEAVTVTEDADVTVTEDAEGN